MKVKDVVCGMTIDDNTAAAESSYQGEKYKFCSETCKAKFEKEPEKYASKQPASTK